jgi:hypothetical protein
MMSQSQLLSALQQHAGPSRGPANPPPPYSSAPSLTAVNPPGEDDQIGTILLQLLENERQKAHRQGLQQANLSQEALRKDIEEQRIIIEKLKDQAEKGGISTEEEQLRIEKLKRELATASTKASKVKSGMFRKICSTDLLFLVDTTSSMSGYINAAKEQIRTIVSNLDDTFFGKAEVRMAVVGYKDHADTPNIQFLDFTPSAREVESFISTLSARGGGDMPEDVLGGIRQALNATWRLQNRCIIHIGDAPPHGRDFHTSPGVNDKYPKCGSEPHGLTYAPLLRRMINLKINYTLLRIHDETDRMALTFLKTYADASAECRLHASNKFHREASRVLARPITTRRSKKHKGLSFEELQLGTSFDSLKHLVVRSVTDSASRNATELASGMLRDMNEGSHSDKLSVVKEEDGRASTSVKMETVAPKWADLGWFGDVLVVEGFSPDIVVHSASTLDDMMAHDDNIKIHVSRFTVHRRARPFAEGVMRRTSYARTAASTSPFVVKSFKKRGKEIAHFAEDMRVQAICKAFALEFNGIVGEDNAVDFIVTTCLKARKRSGFECLSLEPFIEGEYVKYNNNASYVNPSNDKYNKAAQAFSHFTFERSRGRFMIVDLQGVGNVWTDPAIHTKDPERYKLSDTNFGEEGFMFFFLTHQCNNICHKLGLKSRGEMISSGNFDFKRDWTVSAGLMVCCSNKICGKIMRAAMAITSSKYPEHRWCATCYAQLSRSTEKWICAGPGPYHEFDVSKFFIESQGGTAPRKCPEHRGAIASTSQTRPQVNLSQFVANSNQPNRRQTMNPPVSEPSASPAASAASELNINLITQLLATLAARAAPAETVAEPLAQPSGAVPTAFVPPAQDRTPVQEAEPVHGHPVHPVTPFQRASPTQQRRPSRTGRHPQIPTACSSETQPRLHDGEPRLSRRDTFGAGEPRSPKRSGPLHSFMSWAKNATVKKSPSLSFGRRSSS